MSAQIESRFVAEDYLVQFLCSQITLCLDTTLNGRVGGWVLLAALVLGTAIPDVLHPGTLRYLEKTQGPLMKVLSVSEQRPMRQLALSVLIV
ncbi:hypothetical protein TNCV_3094351 [Trichonephila clavipes]|nr:hypothetical protein TNCV_3094351 [Trichonephila clavipes]